MGLASFNKARREAAAKRDTAKPLADVPNKPPAKPVRKPAEDKPHGR